MERQYGSPPNPLHQMNKRLTCLTAIFLTQLLAGIGLSHSVQARPYPESESIPKLDSYLKERDDSRSQVSDVLGACWTLGATNPRGNDQSAKWADAQNQLRQNFRRDANLRPYRVTGYCKGHTKGFQLRTNKNATNTKPGSDRSNTPQSTGSGYGACWTLDATNPKGKNQSERWADAQNQLRQNFRRDANLRPYRVTGYCKDHTKGFKFRTFKVATNRKPGPSARKPASTYLDDPRFICATAPFSAEACLTRREWLSILLNWGSGDTTVTMQIPNYGTYTKTIRAWASILKTHSFSSAKTNRSRVPIRASWSGNNKSGIGITEAGRPINWFAD